MVSVAGPAQAARSTEELVALGHGPLGPGFGGAEGPVSHRFRVHFGRSAKALAGFVKGSGPATMSDILRSNWDGGREPWRAAADWTWGEEEGLGEGSGGGGGP